MPSGDAVIHYSLPISAIIVLYLVSLRSIMPRHAGMYFGLFYGKRQDRLGTRQGFRTLSWVKQDFTVSKAFEPSGLGHSRNQA